MTSAQDAPIAEMLGNIRAEMARRGVTLAELGDAIGIATANVHHRMRGTVPLRVSELYAIAQRLGVPVTALLPAERDAASVTA